jgi:hypothetical protein
VTETIHALATLGLHLFPVDHADLPRCIGCHRPGEPCDGKRGKHPAVAWSRCSTTDPAVLQRMFSRGPRNVGIDCGRSRLVVLDEDAPGELDRLCTDHGQQLPDTFTVSTGRGRHVYFRQPAGLPYGNAEGGLRDYKVNVRGRGGYVVGPGSKHENGCTYLVLTSAKIVPVPEWIEALLCPPAPVRRAPLDSMFMGSPRALAGLLQVVLDAPVGQRNTRLNWGAYRMFEKVADGLLAEPLATRMLLDAAIGIGLSEGEARGTIASARRAVLRD